MEHKKESFIERAIKCVLSPNSDRKKLIQDIEQENFGEITLPVEAEIAIKILKGEISYSVKNKGGNKTIVFSRKENQDYIDEIIVENVSIKAQIAVRILEGKIKCEFKNNRFYFTIEGKDKEETLQILNLFTLEEIERYNIRCATIDTKLILDEFNSEDMDASTKEMARKCLYVYRNPYAKEGLRKDPLYKLLVSKHESDTKLMSPLLEVLLEIIQNKVLGSYPGYLSDSDKDTEFNFFSETPRTKKMVDTLKEICDFIKKNNRISGIHEKSIQDIVRKGPFNIFILSRLNIILTFMEEKELSESLASEIRDLFDKKRFDRNRTVESYYKVYLLKWLKKIYLSKTNPREGEENIGSVIPTTFDAFKRKLGGGVKTIAQSARAKLEQTAETFETGRKSRKRITDRGNIVYR